MFSTVLLHFTFSLRYIFIQGAGACDGLNSPCEAFQGFMDMATNCASLAADYTAWLNCANEELGKKNVVGKSDWASGIDVEQAPSNYLQYQQHMMSTCKAQGDIAKVAGECWELCKKERKEERCISDEKFQAYMKSMCDGLNSPCEAFQGFMDMATKCADKATTDVAAWLKCANGELGQKDFGKSKWATGISATSDYEKYGQHMQFTCNPKASAVWIEPINKVAEMCWEYCEKEVSRCISDEKFQSYKKNMATESTRSLTPSDALFL